jgi:hypothetical protein
MSGFGLIGNFEPRDALPKRGVLTAWTQKSLHTQGNPDLGLRV